MNSEVKPNEVPLYSDRKKLSTELAKYMSRDIRPRYKAVLSSFYTKYEACYNKETPSFRAKKKALQPKEISKRMDEIAKRRSDLKKMAKKEEIDKKLKTGKFEVEKEEEEDENEKVCMV